MIFGKAGSRGFGWIVVGGVFLGACHLQNQTDAVVAVDSGGAGSQTSSISGLSSLSVLTAPSVAQNAFCPSAKKYVDSSVGESLAANCKGCHSPGSNAFEVDPSLEPGASFVKLIEYLRVRSEPGGRAVDHLLITKAQGISPGGHGGNRVWQGTDPRLGSLAELIEIELEIPCDPDATLRRAEELEGVDDASSESSSDDTAVDEDW